MVFPNKRLWPVLFLALGLSLGTAPGFVQAATAQNSRPQSSVTVNPIGLAYGIANLEYEHLLGADTAGAARVNFFSRGLGDFNANAIGFGASYRWFAPLGTTEAAPRGLWYGPSVDYLQVNAKFAGDNSTSSFFQVSGDIGYKWILAETANLVLSPFAQLGYMLGSLSVANNNLDYGNRFVINVGLSVGLAF